MNRSYRILLEDDAPASPVMKGVTSFSNGLTLEWADSEQPDEVSPGAFVLARAILLQPPLGR
jgi:hypothetical protein